MKVAHLLRRTMFQRVLLIAGFVLICSQVTSPAEEPLAEKKSKVAKGGGSEKWEETIKRFETADAAKPPVKGGVLLVGGSNARRWTDVSDYFPDHKVLNRGFGGARLENVLYYVDRIVLPYAPKVIILNAGGNDLSSGSSPQQICDAARAFITKVEASLPDTKIFIVGIPPVRRAAQTPDGLDGLRKMNRMMEEMTKTQKHVEFIDLFPSFLDDKGEHRAELFVEDGTHFSPKGYKTLSGLLLGKF
jgi:lysophospholipase L1-like esterase